MLLLFNMSVSLWFMLYVMGFMLLRVVCDNCGSMLQLCELGYGCDIYWIITCSFVLLLGDDSDVPGVMGGSDS